MDVVTVEPLKHLITVDEYEAMGASGIFPPDRRLELIEGEIIEMAPIGPAHAWTVTRLTNLLVQRAGERGFVWAQNPVRLGDVTTVQPDVCLIDPGTPTHRHPLPYEILLAVEVADTTLQWDRSVKIPLYARAGVVEIWVIDVNERTVEVCRGPGESGYSEISTFGVDDEITLSGLDGVVIRVADFLG